MTADVNSLRSSTIKESEMTPVEVGWMKRIKEHAAKHYEEGGWDFVVECWGIEEFGEFFARTVYLSYSSALRDVREIASLHNERRQDVRSTIW
jgi:hypothetical protein